MRIPPFLLFSLICLSSCDIPMGNPDTYSAKIDRFRYTKDSLFKVGEQSPMDAPRRVKFVELNYYKPDRSYAVDAALAVFPRQDTIEMAGSRGDVSEYIKYALLRFKLHGKDCQLIAYKPADGSGSANSLFIPFYDPTNQKETYHGGRYIETEYEGAKSMTLDFNMAISPYCSYSDNFSCPIPPKENTLAIPVKAGEMQYDPFFR